jgi:urea transporter
MDRPMMSVYLEDIGQSLFLKNAFFGAALLLLFLVFDPHAFIYGVIASLIGYIYTLRNSTPKALKDSGLITLNGFFFGIAMASLFQESPLAYLCLAVGALTIPIATKASFEVLQHWKLSPYVVPYALSIWMIWLCAGCLSLQVRHDLWPEVIATLPPLHSDWPLWHVLLEAAGQSIGRLLFLPNTYFGLTVLALVTLFSPRRGLFLLIGTTIATLLAALVSTDGFAWEYGFFSFCGGLVALALAASPEKISVSTILFFCLLSCFLTIASDQFMRELRLPLLSLPYILTMWLVGLSRVPRVNMSWKRSTPPALQSKTVKAREELREEVA